MKPLVKLLLLVAASFFLTMGLLLALSFSAQADTLIVTNNNDNGEGSLRQALLSASVSDTITFDLTVFPPGNPATITLLSPLPKIITDGLTIDGNGGVILDGHVLTEAHGLRIDADNVTISNLQIVNFDWSGIRVYSGSENTTIEGNVIGGNHNYGIKVEGDNITNTRILSNFLGIDDSGTANSNTLSGISIEAGSSNTLIQGNVIAFNDDHGIMISGTTTSNIVIGNSIGTDASGCLDLGNNLNGIIIRGGAQGNIIGPGNTIAYNGWDGVCVEGATTLSNTITRNSITANDDLGISNEKGGNGELAPPTIITVTDTAILGQASQPGATIDLFTDPFFEGQQFVVSTTADAGGNFTATLATPLTEPLVTATSTDAAGNTSEFGAFCRLQDIWPDKIWPYCTTEPTPISSPFGPRLMASEDFRYDFHRGVDLPAPLETPFYAIADGVVTKVVTDPPDGTIRISHTDPVTTYYSHYRHVSQTLVITGQVVSKGMLIGSTGKSASGFAHLHFEIRDEPGGYEKYSVNPFGRMPYTATNDYEIEISGVYVDPTDPTSSTTVLLTVTGPRQELDLNRFTVSIDGSERVLDFNNLNQTQTPAPNNTNPDILDNPYQDGICIMPAPFNKHSDEYRIDLTFYDLPGSNSGTLTAGAADVHDNVVSTTEPYIAENLSISPNYAESWISPGMTGTLIHTLTNNIAATHTFTMTRASAQGQERWDVQVTPPSVTLGPGMSATITVTVAISEAVPIGTVDCIAVMAASEEGIQAIAVDVITASRIYLPIIMKNHTP